MYLEGLGFRSIGRILGVSNVAVLKWIKGVGEKVQKLSLDSSKELKNVEIMELDELWHFISKKKTSVGFGWLLIENQDQSSKHNLVIVQPKQQENFGIK